MRMYLKRGEEFTPIVFEHPLADNKKCIQIKDTGYTRTSSEEGFKIDINSPTEYIKCNNIDISRNKLNYYTFPGGLFRQYSKNELIVVIVKHNQTGEKYAIIDKSILRYPTYLTRIKRSLKELGIIRKNILIWEESQIYKEFQEILVPTMQDYLPEVQMQISKEFLALSV